MALYIQGDRVDFMTGENERVGVITRVYEEEDEDDIAVYEIMDTNSDIHEIPEDDIIDLHNEEPIPMLANSGNVTTTNPVGDIDRMIRDYYVPMRDMPAPREVNIVEITADNIGTLTRADYMPNAESARHCIIPLANGIRLTPTRIIGGFYVFKDEDRNTWLNHVAIDEVILYSTHIDIAGVRWATVNQQRDFQRNRGVDVVKRSIKKLRRKYPMPELKDKKYYDDNKFIA